VFWTRAPGWDGERTEISLSADEQAAAAGGRTIYNDPANGNWVQMAAAQVTGNMPTPLELIITNTSGAAKAYNKLIINVNAFSDPANLVHYLQGEDVVSGGSTVESVTSSGGNLRQFTVNSTPTTYQWTLPQDDIRRTNGRRARLTVRFSAITGATYVRPKILDGAGAQVLWAGDELYFGLASKPVVLDLGAVPLPPGGSTTTYGAQRLGLEFRGASTVDLDVIQLSMLDSYRYMALPGLSVANNASVVVDGIEGLTYMLSASSVSTPLATTFGKPLMLQANTLQRIYVLYEVLSTPDMPIGATASVRAYARARRLTV
jgi:hypothetical protein